MNGNEYLEHELPNEIHDFVFKADTEKKRLQDELKVLRMNTIPIEQYNKMHNHYLDEQRSLGEVVSEMNEKHEDELMAYRNLINAYEEELISIKGEQALKEFAMKNMVKGFINYKDGHVVYGNLDHLKGGG